MKSTNDVKAFYRSATVDTNPARDEAILADALQAGGLETKTRAAHAEPSVWRAIMKNRTTQLTTAAVIAVVLFIILHQLGSSIDGTTVVWGDVRDAFLDRPWVHLKYDNSAEQWYDLKTGDHFFQDWDGRCVAIDRTANLRQTYDPIHGKHINENRPVVYPNDVIPPWEPKTAWEAIVGPWEQMAQQGGAGHWEVETSKEETEGQPRIRFDCYFNDAAGRRLLVRQIWADPQTRLPLAVWKRLSLADRQEQQRESITGTFDFPDHGPQSIYDLGVARDLPVAKSYDKVPLSSVQEVIEAAQEALRRFPARYRVVVWPSDRNSEVEVVWRDGQRIRHDHYFNLSADRTPQHHLRLPATVAEVLDWAQTQPPISTSMFDGQRTYTREYVHPVYADSRDEVRVTRSRDGFLLGMWSRPIELQWPWERHNPASYELIDDAPEAFRAYIGLKREGGSIRRDYYLDPEHDYICVHNIWWKQRSGQCEKEREYEHSDFKRLPTGQWYAGKWTVITYPDPERGTVRGGETKNIEVEVLDEGDFPRDTFDGEKLMEGATLETY